MVKPQAKPAAFGGNMWESNPPGRLLAPLNGFEDRGAHQHPSTPMGVGIVAQLFSKSKPFFVIIRGIPDANTANRRLFS